MPKTLNHWNKNEMLVNTIVFQQRCLLWTSKFVQHVITFYVFHWLGIHPRIFQICRKWAICSGSGPPQHAPEGRMTWVPTNSLKLLEFVRRHANFKKQKKRFLFMDARGGTQTVGTSTSLKYLHFWGIPPKQTWLMDTNHHLMSLKRSMYTA